MPMLIMAVPILPLLWEKGTRAARLLGTFRTHLNIARAEGIIPNLRLPVQWDGVGCLYARVVSNYYSTKEQVRWLWR